MALQALTVMLIGAMLTMNRRCWSDLGMDFMKVHLNKLHCIFQPTNCDLICKLFFLFRGKNFVIKYEGCFSNGDSDCFVLEHVEHDRPEVIIRYSQFLFSFVCLSLSDH